jgi:hypothetical protein
LEDKDEGPRKIIFLHSKKTRGDEGLFFWGLIHPDEGVFLSETRAKLHLLLNIS